MQTNVILAGAPVPDADSAFSAPLQIIGTHASPRLHWRRGHRRHLPDGKATWVRACLVGDPFAGTVSHDYQLTTGEAA